MKSASNNWDIEGDKVGEVGESAILDLFVSPEPQPWLPVPNGDDAAVLDPKGARVVLSVDSVLEHQHFKREWLSPSELGARSLYVSASDIAAMGAVPKWCLISAQIPADLSFAALRNLVTGLKDACELEGVHIIGGNLSKAEVLGLHVTVGGFLEAQYQAITREGARVGDSLWVSGQPGRAAAGRWLLDRAYEDSSLSKELIAAWRRPEERWSFMSRLRSEAEVHAAIDLSDGLAIDARRMALASGKSFLLDLEALDASELMKQAGEAAGIGPAQWILAGGEDYELLFAAPGPLPQWAMEQGARYVGRVEEGEPGLQVVSAGETGTPELFSAGWDPFR